MKSSSIFLKAFAALFIAGAMFFIALGFHYLLASIRFVDTGVLTSATVTEVISEVNREGMAISIPVVEFAGSGGGTEHHKLNEATNRYSVGDRMEVIYDRNDPSKVIRNSFALIYVTPLMTMVLGFLTIVIVYSSAFGKNERSLAPELTGPARADAIYDRSHDPVALKTDWIPIHRAASMSATGRFVVTSPGIIRFRPSSIMEMLFSAIVVVPFVALTGLDGMTPGVGVVLIAVMLGGAYVLYLVTKPIFFDRKRGVFIKGRGKAKAKSKSKASSRSDGREGFIMLHDIHALQILSKLTGSTEDKGPSSSLHTFELNLVLADGSRIKVVSHGNLRRIREDAGLISGFLGVPVWDTAEG